MDILVNNAGIAINRTLQETSCEEWDRMMNINARAPFLLCKAALPHLKQSGRGTIIQIVSVVGVKGYVDQGAYSASKHALMGMSKVLAQEVQSDNVRVHTILPGGVATEMISSVRPDLDPAYLMQPKEIAEIVMFLLTHQGNAVIDSINVRRAASTPWF
jgi:NAD(P)-dependent dehydrogenase (short-subunit alcohol dehydrogenase family)